ncbi:MAG: glycosyltransferase family 39 protein [Kofleriaceae bacterium]
MPEPHALPTAQVVARRPLKFEVVFVVLIAAAVLVPGIWKYSLVDPWETHYGEVARAMLQDNDFVHTNWPGTSSGSPNDLEGFRSKPVLMFWMMAAGRRAVGAAEHGGYSGELTDSVRVMVGIRLPFILSAIAGLTLMWWMLARLVSRRAAWLGLLVVGSTPIFCLISRQAIPDMPMVACTIGAIAMFLMAVEDGDRPILRIGTVGRGRFAYDARHIVLALTCGFVLVQAAYYAVFFASNPVLGVRGTMPNPAFWLPALMVVFTCALSRDGWLIFRIIFVLLGGIIAAIVNEPMPLRRPGQSGWRHVFDDILGPWERHAPDRYAVRGLVFPIVWALGGSWAATHDVATKIVGMQPLTQMRQLFMLACYFLLGVSLLAKGPPGFTVVALVGFFHLVYFRGWSDLFEGRYELKRGLLMISVVAIPWHVGMWLKEGIRFVDEYFYTHILNRAGAGVDNSPGTFEYYINQLGHGMWLWAALLPAALAAAMLRANRDTREGRVRFTITLWAICAMALFCLVQTKFHHYILPAIPPLALLVALFLDDVAAKRERLHPLYAALGIGIVLLVTRDLMYEPERWIEMFVFRYDRPWPNAEPYVIDTSDGFLVLGLVAAGALAAAATRFTRIGVGLVCAAGLAICIWSLQAYMPVAGKHWGMREAIRSYYEQRAIYGEKIVYFGDAQLADDWRDAGATHTFETFIPDTLYVGQPMTITIQVNKPDDERVLETEVVLTGVATAIGDHSVEVTLPTSERAKLTPLIARGARSSKRGRPPVHAVDADRLIAWQLYWRGEQFWSGGEIWSWLPEMKVSFVNTNNVEFLKYINDRTRAPIGRRYFVVTEASRITSIRAFLPERGRNSFEVIDTTSNKFSIAAFYL